METTSLTTKKGTEAGTDNKENDVEDDCHGLIVAFFWWDVGYLSYGTYVLWWFDA